MIKRVSFEVRNRSRKAHKRNVQSSQNLFAMLNSLLCAQKNKRLRLCQNTLIPGICLKNNASRAT